MTHLSPSRAPLTLKPQLPTMFTIRNVRRSKNRWALALEAALVWAAVGALVWYLLSH